MGRSDVNAQTKIKKADPPEGLALLRKPFPPHHISKLPKPTKAQTDAVRADFKKGIRCKECGSWHHPDVVHLDYVGHAALTDRLLDTDPHWTWEPVSFGQDGLPAFDRNGGLWIKLTVLGVTRLGYGSADGKEGGDAIKEIIGDALRNAAMRFGAALDLWHKGDLHGDEPTSDEVADAPGMPDAEWSKLVQLIEATKSDTNAMCKHYGVKNLRHLNQDQFGNALAALKAKLAKMAKEETNAKASTLAQELEDEIQF
jgi:hypothetical protein